MMESTNIESHSIYSQEVLLEQNTYCYTNSDEKYSIPLKSQDKTENSFKIDNVLDSLKKPKRKNSRLKDSVSKKFNFCRSESCLNSISEENNNLISQTSLTFDCSDTEINLNQTISSQHDNYYVDKEKITNENTKKKDILQSETGKINKKLDKNDFKLLKINQNFDTKSNLISCSDEDIQKVLKMDKDIGLEFLNLVKNNFIQDIYWTNLSIKLKSLNLYFLRGQYSFLEKQKLRDNWDKLKTKIPFDDPLVIFTYQKDEQKKQIKEYINTNNIFQKLSKGLNRSINSVYLHAKNSFLLKKEKDKIKWSVEEKDRLIKLQMKYGNDWKKISEKLGRSAQCCKDKISLLKSPAIGNWSEEEDKKLFDAVIKYLKENEEQLANEICELDKNVINNSSDEFTIPLIYKGDYNKLPWERISKAVPNRGRRQCRSRWLLTLLHNLKKSDKYCFTMHKRKKLVKILIDMNPQSEAYINWSIIAQKFKSIPSPQFLQHQFWLLKKLVSDYNIKTLFEILNELYEGIQILMKQ